MAVGHQDPECCVGFLLLYHVSQPSHIMWRVRYPMYVVRGVYDIDIPNADPVPQTGT